MIADVTNVSCAYIQEAIKFIDSLRFGIHCYNEDLLFRLEQDVFMITSGCDVEWCYTCLVEEPDCTRLINCNITLADEVPKALCPEIRFK